MSALMGECSYDRSEEDCSSDSCLVCGEEPCCVVAYKAELVDTLLYCSTLPEDMPAKGRRFHAYKEFIRILYGDLGKGFRVPVPFCIEHIIRDTFPAPDVQYTGFIELDSDDNSSQEDPASPTKKQRV